MFFCSARSQPFGRYVFRRVFVTRSENKQFRGGVGLPGLDHLLLSVRAASGLEGYAETRGTESGSSFVIFAHALPLKVRRYVQEIVLFGAHILDARLHGNLRFTRRPVSAGVLTIAVLQGSSKLPAWQVRRSSRGSSHTPGRKNASPFSTGRPRWCRAVDPKKLLRRPATPASPLLLPPDHTHEFGRSKKILPRMNTTSSSENRGVHSMQYTPKHGWAYILTTMV